RAAPRRPGGVPGPDRLARPADAGGRHPRRAAGHPPRAPRGGAAADPAAARAGRAAAGAREPLPGGVLRRAAPADRHRAGAGAGAQAAGAGRAGVGPRRLHPGGDHQPARGPAGAAGARLPVRRPRPVGGAPRRRPGGRHVPGPDRGDRRRPLRVPHARPPVHAGAALGDTRAGPRRRALPGAHPAHRGPARPDGAAVRLPVPLPLLPLRRARRGRPAAVRARRPGVGPAARHRPRDPRPRGRVPLRRTARRAVTLHRPKAATGGTPMRIRSTTVLALVTAFALTACGGGAGGGGGAPVAAPDELQQGQNDINPVPRDQVRDGGDLRWPLDQLPDNFNRNHIDGTLEVNSEVVSALLPFSHRTLPDATVEVDSDYFTSIELTSTEPQTVTYTIRPEATWDDGTPITWRDLQAQWQVMNGSDPAFQVSSTTGYEDIASVERGVDDKQAVVTFARVFSEWRSLFSPIYPVATNTDPDTFNRGWINAVPNSAGPFRLEGIDTTAQTITLVRNEKWWGEPAKLDRIIFRVVERAALADALANGEIDWYAIGSDINLFTRAQTIPG